VCCYILFFVSNRALGYGAVDQLQYEAIGVAVCVATIATTKLASEFTVDAKAK